MSCRIRAHTWYSVCWKILFINLYNVSSFTNSNVPTIWDSSIEKNRSGPSALLFISSTSEPRRTQRSRSLLRIYERPLEGSIAIYRGCLLSRYICALLTPCRIPKPGVSHPMNPLDVGDTPRGQIRPKVHYYPCIVLLNIDSIAFE